MSCETNKTLAFFIWICDSGRYVLEKDYKDNKKKGGLSKKP
jgi:hypothetical protein